MKIASSKPTNKRILVPPIPLECPEKKKLDKSDYASFKLRNNPAEANSTQYEVTIKYFQSGSPEELLEFIRDIKRVIEGQNLTTGPSQFNLMRRMLRGDALAAFKAATQEAGNETVAHFNTVIQGLITHVFPMRALITCRSVVCIGS